MPYSKVRGPKAVKYVWSEKLPVGTRLESNGGLTQARVLRSGAPASRDAWVEERVNALQEWKAAFKESETPKVGGIAVLTDADDTKSTAARRLPQLPRLPRLSVRVGPPVLSSRRRQRAESSRRDRRRPSAA